MMWVIFYEKQKSDVSLPKEAVNEVRLAAGRSRYEGRAEVRHRGIWGTICDDGFNPTSCIIICKQLGHRLACCGFVA
jgi:Scavenger receptor cysteine-rich domain